MTALHKPLETPGILEDRTVSLTRALVQIPSITAIDPQDRPASRACLAMLAHHAQETGASVEYLTFEGGHHKWGYAVDNIYVEWTFGSGEKHLCYMGHVDVVPPGDAAKWTDDPFSGEIRDGYLYGRGVTDMKGSVAAFITAVAQSAGVLQKSNLRISMVITADEEWAAVNGSKKVLQWMKDNGKTPDAFIVGEPSAQDVLGTHIKIGRRGSLCGTFSVKGVQGHAAYQGLFENPNRALALAMSILNSHRFSDGNENFPNTNFEPVAIKSGDFNASAVIPGAAEMLWNIRFTPQHTPESLENWVNQNLQNPPEWAKNHPDADMLKNISVTANKDTASHPYYSEPSTLAAAAIKAAGSVLGIETKPDGSGGTTDGRFAAKIFPQAEIIELGLPERGGIVDARKPADYLLKGGMHQVDERATLTDLVNLREIFIQTMVNYGNP